MINKDMIITCSNFTITNFAFNLLNAFCYMILFFLIFVWIFMIYDAIRFTYDNDYDNSKTIIQAYVETIILLTLEVIITLLAVTLGFSTAWLIMLAVFIIMAIIIYNKNK